MVQGVLWQPALKVSQCVSCRWDSISVTQKRLTQRVENGWLQGILFGMRFAGAETLE